jgi:outer membrane immunogenic protein
MKIAKILLVAAAIAVAGTPVLAADMAAAPTYSKAPVAALAYNWTGFYGGLNAGGVWSDAGTAFTASPVFFAGGGAVPLSADGSVGLSKTGFTGGAQAGYNWQSDRFVLGLEADINYTDIKKSASVTRATSIGLPLGYTVFESVSSDWLATVRGRAGFAANNWLFYVTGGLAVANFGFTQGSTFPDCPCGVVRTSSSTKTGWTAGGGVEYAIGAAWSVKAEYLYVDLGTQSFSDNLGAFGFPLAAFTHQAHLKENIARVGLNYHFGSSVVARY